MENLSAGISKPLQISIGNWSDGSTYHRVELNGECISGIMNIEISQGKTIFTLAYTVDDRYGFFNKLSIDQAEKLRQVPGVEVKFEAHCVGRDKDKNKLKIIMNYDEDRPISSKNTTIYFNDEAIGLIQEFNLQIKNSEEAKLDIKFPDLNLDIIPQPNETYFKTKDVIENTSKLKYLDKHISYVNIDKGNTITTIEEIGTDGYIDSFIINRG